jgi:hypothetical protein
MSAIKRMRPKQPMGDFPAEEIATVTSHGQSVWTTPEAEASAARFFEARGVRLSTNDTPEALICAAQYLQIEVDRRLSSQRQRGRAGDTCVGQGLTQYEQLYLDAVRNGYPEVAISLFHCTRWKLGLHRALRAGKQVFWGSA